MRRTTTKGMKCFVLSLILVLSSAAAQALVQHQLDVQVLPAVKSLTVLDHLSFSAPTKHRTFSLHKNLHVSSLSADVVITKVADGTYEWSSATPHSEVTLQYSGVIYDPVVDDTSSGLVSTEGAVLFGSSYWLPQFDELMTYEITSSSLPPGWLVASPVAQSTPQEEVYFIAGPFTLWTLPGAVTLKVYLRSPDAALAQQFLSLLPGYLDHYQNEIGAYPYSSFAVVENFWETGFGMPGFTLLGSNVLRLPYILNSSLPHELLHDWWGNGVYVDYNRGNWSEGLTTYMGDHWQQEVLGKDHEYRLTTLANYQDYASQGQDFPLRQFKGRHSFSTQAVGYGKGMMFFHMLKDFLPDGVFNRALRNFYQTYKHQNVSYEEIQKSFEQTSGLSLQTYFTQWLDRTGAPSLTLSQAKVTAGSYGFQGSFTLSQQALQNYDLPIPLRWTFADGSRRNETVMLQNAQQSFSVSLAKKPISLEVDPDIDLFRTLAPQERPLSLSQVFGAKKIWLVSSADAATQSAYIQSWKTSLGVDLQPSADTLLQNLPLEGAVVLLGDSPIYAAWMQTLLQGQDFLVGPDQIKILGQSYARAQNSTVVVASDPKHTNLFFVWIRGGIQAELAPRILHYGKFGVLIFTDKANTVKTTWPVLDSPLKWKFP